MAATATLATKTLTVQPGGEAISEIRIRNSGTVVDQFSLEVLGDASAWAIVEPAVVPLFPGAEAVARIRFKPPKSPSVLAKPVPFAVRVKSSEDSRASLVEEGIVEVGPFNDTFAELIPRNAKGSSRARAQLALDNRGNIRINARLTAADPDRKLNFSISPPALTAEPGTASFAQVRLTPRQRFLTGPPKTNPYKVLVHQDGLPTITVDGTMQQYGLLPTWIVPALIALLALVIIGAVLWLVLLKPAITSTAQQAAADSKAVQAANANASSALAKVNALPKATTLPSVGIVGPNGGGAFSSRMALGGNNTTTSIPTVAQGANLAVTDLIFENPTGNSGALQLVRKTDGKPDETLLTVRLENYRDLDFHFISPLVFDQGQTMMLTCQPDASSSCNGTSVYYSGYYKNPPGS